VLLFFRMVLLAVHFVIASVVGLLIGLCRPFNPDNSRLCARVYALPAMRILGLKVKLEDETVRDHIRPAVIVSNHISNYDLMVFGLTVPRRTVSLGKKSLKWIPLFGQLYWLAGNVLVDRGNAIQAKKAMLTTTDTLQHKDMSLWVFAEGTRGHGKGLQPFKKGAFLMAINAGVPIIPICGNNYVRGMRLNRWHSGNIIIRSLSPIPTTGLSTDDVPKLMAECHARMAACIDELDREAGTLKA
jgi:1-acyl-sn-glycerol-3-phosphate acyltransferase